MVQKTYTNPMTRLMPFGALLSVAVFMFSPSGEAVAWDEQTAPVQEISAPVPDEVPEPAAQMRMQAGLSEPEPRTAPANDEAAQQQQEEYIEEFGAVPPKTDADVTVMADPFAGQYQKGTPDNLSKLYWRLRVFDLDDNAAVDNYMLINECDLYQRYIHDDFEWVKIRDAARTVLKKERDAYSNQFEFILPVRLGRYDTEYGGFHLVEGSAFENVRRMEITGNNLATEICGRNGEIKDYPRNLMLILKKPLSYGFAKVDEHVAQAFIIRKQKEVLGLDYDSRLKRYDRVAYVRLRVNLEEYQGNLKGQDGTILSILYGTLKGVDIFGDPYGKMLLSTLDVTDPEALSREMAVPGNASNQAIPR